MRRYHRILAPSLLALAALMTCVSTAPAQLVSDGATNVLSAVTNTVTGDLTVGTNGSATALVLTNAAEVDVSGSVFIGRQTGSFSNAVYLAGPGTLLTMGSNLYVGSNGWGNLLDVRAGAVVSNYIGYIGYNTNSSNNTVILSDAGTTWSVASNLFVGFRGAGNRLIITNGAVSTSRSATVGDATNSDGNSVLISGPGARWGALDTVSIGNRGRSNSLVIRAGGVVISTNFFVGSNTLGGDNLVVVSDPGSMLSNSSSLYIGYGTMGNQLIVSNGAAVICGLGMIGTPNVELNGKGSHVIVTGPGSVWTNRSLVVGPNGTSNTLFISDGGSVFTGNDAIISVPFDGHFGSANGITVINPNSKWTVGRDVSIGFYGGGDRLIVDDAATVSIGRNLMIESGSWLTADNSATVSVVQDLVGNGGSFLNISNAAKLSVGRSVSGGTINIFNAASLSVGQTLSVGGSSYANALTVSNAALSVTNISTNGMLSGTNGGLVMNGTAYVESDLLAGSWTNWQFNGGTLINRGGNVSGMGWFTVGATGKSPATWELQPGLSNMTVGATVIIGSNTPASQLRIFGGQKLLTGTNEMVVGFTTNSVSNFVLISGAGSRLDPAWLTLGYRSSNNTLRVTDGASVTPNSVTLGQTNTSRFNQLILDGLNSALTTPSTGRVFVGEYGSRHQLIVSNGAVVSARTIHLGLQTVSSNNEFIVTGPGSQFRPFAGTAESLRIGDQGRNNRVVVSDGGLMTNAAFFIGVSNTSSGNSLLVTDPGSLVTSSNASYVGYLGSRNSLVISNGGAVVAGNITLGFASSTGTNNEVVVTGAGSLLSLSGTLRVGDGGQGNRVTVTNGGTIVTRETRLDTNNNSAWISGAGSWWSNRIFIVGESGSGTALHIDGGTVLVSSNLTVGSTATSSNNVILINGGTLSVTNAAANAGFVINRGTNVLNSGVVEADRLYLTNTVGAFEFNGGSLTVRNLTNANGRAFVVGNGSSAAFLTLVGGGTNLFDSGLVISSNAQLDFHSATLRTTGTTNHTGGAFVVGDGASSTTLELSGNGIHDFGPGLLLTSNATLLGSGLITSAVTNSGRISPGVPNGAITLGNSLSLAANARLTFEISGLIPTNQHDVLTVNSFVELAGNLELSLIRSFIPSSNDAFTVFNFASATGSFANATSGFRLNTTDGLGSFLVTISPTNLIASNYVSPDTDNDGLTDYVEYLLGIDSDGDGQNDYAEYLAGTDPNDPASYLGITAITQNAGNHLVIQFQSVAAKIYRIEYSNDLLAWPTATTNVPSAGASTTWTDDGTLTGGLPTGPRFYRVGLQ